MKPVVDQAAPSVGPRVFVRTSPRTERLGPIDLVRIKPASVNVGEVVIVEWEKVCAAPCGVEVDVRENPRFGFVRDGKLLMRPFRIPAERGDVTLKLRESNKGLFFASAVVLVVLPLSIPGFVFSSPRVWAAEGRPNQRNEFARLRWAG